MNGPALLADHLNARLDDILALWQATVQREGDVPESERLSLQEFIDHIPELLDQVADRLRGKPTNIERTGKQHARNRWLNGYDVGAVVSELGHLRTALIRATFGYAQQEGLDVAELEPIWRAINDVLNEVTTESVEQFQRQMQTEFETRQHALSDQRRAVRVGAAEAGDPPGQPAGGGLGGRRRRHDPRHEP